LQPLSFGHNASCLCYKVEAVWRTKFSVVKRWSFSKWYL